MTTAAPFHLNSVDFPLAGTRLIEASAGTGKTYTIAALYVRLILGHNPKHLIQGRDLLPPDILVVTFTDAATKELRERIRDRLSQAARFFRNQPMEGDAFLEAIRADYDESNWPSCARRLELAANWMDEAAVYTIHGWCNRMLQQHAFDSGGLFQQEVNTNDTKLLNEVVRDYWRSFYYEALNDDPAFQGIYEFFKQPEDLQNEIRPLLNNSDPIPGCFVANQDIKALISSVDASRQEVLKTLKKPWGKWAREIKDLVDTAVEDQVLPAKNYNITNRANWINKIATWSSDPAQEKLDIGTGFKNLSSAGMASLANTGKTPPQHPGFEAIAKLPAQLAALPSLKVELLKHAIHWIRNRYDSEKQRIAGMTFDDMLTRLDKAFQGKNGERLANVIRKQYPIALIDEFQDTDPVQYRIFSTLYPAQDDSELGCFMIGDPKQAIYSFRGADIYTYLKAHQATTGYHYTLGTNFRSTTALVDAVNQVFLQADKQSEGAFRFKTPEENPLPFNAVAAKGRDDEWIDDNQLAPALTLWHWETSESVGMPLYREHMAEVTASEIVRLLNKATLGNTGFKSSATIKPLQPSDIAILVRTGLEAKIMRKALAKRYLRSVYLSEGDSIFATSEAADLLFWLKALAEPRDERKVRAALSTATFGWSYESLHRLVLDEPQWEQHLERFLGYQSRWRRDGILPTLRQLISDYDLHARIARESEGERFITNLLHLAELLQQASTQLEGEQALIRYLAESIEAESRQAGDEGIIRLESDANLIKIITIHKSKGLEYPLVFLPFICSFREVTKSNSKHYRYHDDERNLTIDLGKNEEIRSLSDAERLQEDLRLLYVAITRARYACWLGIAPIKSGNTKDCHLDKSAMGYVLGWQPKMPTSALAEQLKQLKCSCNHIVINDLPAISDNLFIAHKQEEQPDSTRISSTKIMSNWWIASYTALQIEDKQLISEEWLSLPQEPETARDDKHKDEAETDIKVSTMTLAGVHGLPRGSGPGVLAHALLEQCAHQGFSSAQLDLTIENPSLMKDIFNSNGWNKKQYETIIQALSHWLTMPLLEDAKVNLASLGIDAYQAELEFLIGADTVNVQTLDHLVTQFIFAGQPRPSLAPKQVNGLLKGFIDLVFVHNQRYYVVDYKFNSLGNNDTAYTAEALESTMLAKRYDLQSALYLLALHRLLKIRLGESYDYDTHIGGSLYLFLRGSLGPAKGRVFYRPPRALIENLDRLFSSFTATGDIV